MDEVIFGNIVTFRYTSENIELLLINRNTMVTHPKSKIQAQRNLEEQLLREYQNDTGLSLFVISLEPIHEISYTEKIGRKRIKTTQIYYAGIVDPDRQVILPDDGSEYLWIDHLGGRNTLSFDYEVDAYEKARNWLYDHEEAALFLANNIHKLL